jgi:hypothetical protein
MLSKQAVEEFQEIYLKTYGEELSFAEATQQATQIIQLYKVVLGFPFNNQPKDFKNE